MIKGIDGTGRNNDLRRPRRSFASSMTDQMQLDKHSCDISHGGFNWHGASRGPSAMSQLLVVLRFRVSTQWTPRPFACCSHNDAVGAQRLPLDSQRQPAQVVDQRPRHRYVWMYRVARIAVHFSKHTISSEPFETKWNGSHQHVSENRG